MKKILLILFTSVFQYGVYAQCTTANATSCVCINTAQTDCDLLPDITISWYAILNYAGGPNEYSQTGNGADNGRLKVTGSTPNIGHGPLNIIGQWDSASVTWARFLCGTDTVLAAVSNFTCPNGYPLPMQLPYQRIYHKNGNTMSSYLRTIGPVSYHGGGSLYNDDWGIFTLRIQNPAEQDPRDWDIVGTGHKLGFCLMDYYSCSVAPNHCKDTNTIYNYGTTLMNNDFPNWQLGGGNYGCAPTGQGISSGYTDVYSESLGGMWINIPPGTCNGQYWIVYEVDPNNYFLEEDETNNYTAVPYTLTQQASSGNPVISIMPDRSANVCTSELIKLTATAGTAYTWSSGAITQSVLVGAGTYSVTVTNYCGTASASFTVAGSNTPIPLVTNDTICVGTSASLTAMGTNVKWYDSGGALVGTGNNFITPILTSSTTYYVKDSMDYPGTINHVGKFDNSGAGGYVTSTANYLQFDVFRPLKIKSVKVFANGAGNRTIILADEIGIYQQAVIANVPNGESRVNLNFNVQPGKNYSLRLTGNVNLWRNTAGVSYFYTMFDTLSIIGSSAGNSTYYFFYDWEVELGEATCISPPTAVTAIVEICTGIDEQWDLTNNFSVYPNPSGGNFAFDIIMPGSGDVQVRVLDLIGREVYGKLISNLSGKYSCAIDLNDSGKGIYLLDVLIGNKNYYRKLVVQ